MPKYPVGLSFEQELLGEILTHGCFSLSQASWQVGASVQSYPLEASQLYPARDALLAKGLIRRVPDPDNLNRSPDFVSYEASV